MNGVCSALLAFREIALKNQRTFKQKVLVYNCNEISSFVQYLTRVCG